MAEIPSIKIDFVPGCWDKHRRKYITSELKPALEMADDYVRNVLGVESTTRAAIPFLAFRKDNSRGSTETTNTFNLYFSNPEIKRKKLGQMLGEITSTSVHEMTHNYRGSLFPNTTILVERISSEALALTAQAYAEQDIFDIPYEQTVLADNIDGEGLLEDLYGDSRFYMDTTSSAYTRVRTDEWLRQSKDKELSWGERLGVWCIKSWIDDYGYDFPTLLAMPADELIRL